MILNSPTISGSLTVTGNIITSGSITISGSIASASYATNAELLDGLDSTAFATTGAYSATSASLYATSASLSATSGSLSATSGSLSATSGSLSATSGSLSTASGSFNTRVTALEVTGSALSSSLLTVSGSGYATSASLSTASGSFDTRVATIESKYATTGSNNFRAPQYVSDTTVPTGFSNTTGSIYTDGGLQVTKDSYFSGSMFIKGNLTIYGTQSVAYITSSQLNIATNLITVNTATPSVRFGGLAVYDSGSTGTGATGSLLWDSQNNGWVYQRESGSTYAGGMLISGPRRALGSNLGDEQGLTACMIPVAQGGDHITSSLIYHDSTVTCIPGASITSTGAACFASSVTAKNLILNGTATTALDLTSGTFSYGLDLNNNVFLRQKNVAGTLGLLLGLSVDDNLYVRGFSDVNIQVNNGTTALALASTGVATFSNNILIGAGKYLGYSSTAYMTPEDNIQGARIKTPGAFLVESTGATFCSSVTANNFYSTGTTGFWSDAYDVRRNGFYADGTNLIFRAGTSCTGEQTRLTISQSTGAATFSSTITGTTIYGSTAVCSALGYFNGCVGIGMSVYGGSKLTLVASTNPTCASSANMQLSIGEASQNPTYSFKLGYIYVGGGYIGAIQTIAGGAVSTTVINPDGGNVGIGTSGPQSSYKVTISGTDTVYPAIYLENTTNSQAYSIRATGTNFAIRDNSSGNDRMTITCAGNVGIGTSSTTCRRLTIFGESTCVRGIAFRGCAAGDGGNIFLEGYDTDDNEYSNFEFVPNSGNGYFAFNSGAGSNCFNWTQNTRMVIGTSGRVGIGTCTPSAALNVSCVPSSYFGIIETTGTSTGTVKHFRVHKPNCVEYGIGILADNAFHISTASTFPTGNGFTIATNGFIGIGQQAPGGRLEIMNCSAITWSIIARHAVSSGTIYGILSTIQNQAPNNTSSYLFYGDDNVQARMIVYSNGTVSNATGTYNTIASDIRLKQDITNASSQWCDIKNLRLVNFRFKKDVENEGEGALRHLGLIAQEVEETSPNLVEEVTDRCGSTHKTIKTSIIHLKAVKALQEAMCRIEMQQETINILKTCLGIS